MSNRPEPNSTMNKFVQKLKKEGLKEIGSGTMALVFQSKNTNEVIKVFRRDECYVHFLTLVSNNKENTHFPKIFQYEKLTTPPYAGLHIVKMEKLYPVDKYQFFRIEKYINYKITYKFANLEKKQEANDYFTMFKTNYSELNEALELVYSGVQHTCDIDIHLYNVMERSDGTPVIIDPYI